MSILLSYRRVKLSNFRNLLTLPVRQKPGLTMFFKHSISRMPIFPFYKRHFFTVAILLIRVLRIWKDFWRTNKKSKSSLSFRTNNLQHNKKRNLPQFNKSKNKNYGLEFLKQSVLWERQLLSTINQRQNETKLNTYARWRVPEWQLETT